MFVFFFNLKKHFTYGAFLSFWVQSSKIHCIEQQIKHKNTFNYHSRFLNLRAKYFVYMGIKTEPSNGNIRSLKANFTLLLF